MLKVAIVGCGKIADAARVADSEDQGMRDRWRLRQGAADGATAIREIRCQTVF